jgi:thioredoxin reductase (NADPH)
VNAALPEPELTDCLIVGAGPAGLTAAIYLARFHLGAMVIDSGESRAALIPLTRNHAGFPEGITGHDLIARMRRQAERYGAKLRKGVVTQIHSAKNGFVVSSDAGIVIARSVLLATGVVNRRPPMIASDIHAKALETGRLRYCPICDGFEVTDLSVAVLGTGARGVSEALFLRSYTADLTLVAPEDDHILTPEERTALLEAEITIAGSCREIWLDGDAIVLQIDDGVHRFDTLYPALGSDIRSELAGQLGADRTGDGCLTADAHQRTTVDGLYAAGDVVLGLDQISHAMGEGGVAATTIRNDLARTVPQRR